MTARPTATQKAKLSGPPPVEPFVYTAPEGGTITLPPMGKALNAAELRRFRKTGELEMLYYILERDNPAEDDGSNPAIDALDEVLSTMSIDVDVPDLIRQWQEFSKAQMGESKAS